MHLIFVFYAHVWGEEALILYLVHVMSSNNEHVILFDVLH